MRGGLQALPKGSMKRQSRWRWVTGKLRGWLFATGVEAGNSWAGKYHHRTLQDTSLVIIIGLFDLFSSVQQQPLIPPGWVCRRKGMFSPRCLLDLLFQHVAL